MNKVYDIIETPVCNLYILSSDGVIYEVSFEPLPFPKGRLPVYIRREFEEYMAGRSRHIGVRYELSGLPDFYMKVLSGLQTIPYGETRSYAWLAGEAGNPSASRAAGSALRLNPLPLIFPCHRIIRSDGSIGGFSGGIAVKKRLLEMEYRMSGDISS